MTDGATPSPARAWLVRVLYGLVMRLLVPPMLLRLCWRGRAEPLYRQAVAERLGCGGGAPEQGRLWLHAVSLGETRAAAALLDALRSEQPGLRILLTHGTATGRAAGKQLLQAGDAQAWLPWDSPGAVRRFLRAHRPVLGVLMETEVWPALLHAARQQRVPMLLANARLSERSQRRGLRLASLLGPAVQGLSLVLAQTDADAQRLRAFGVRRLVVCGNLKFDMAPDPALLALGRRWRNIVGRPVLLAASTRDGEEAQLLARWPRGPARGGQPLLVIVPRHPQRFDEVAALCDAAGLRPVRRSSWAANGAPGAEAAAADVWLGDSMGELPLYYALADVALLGGSFAPFGGQNLIEAAACGCPLWMGPSTFNFADAAERAVAAGAASQAGDLHGALDGALALLKQPAHQQHQASRALAFAAAHRGAAQCMARAILEELRR